VFAFSVFGELTNADSLYQQRRSRLRWHDWSRRWAFSPAAVAGLANLVEMKDLKYLGMTTKVTGPGLQSPRFGSLRQLGLCCCRLNNDGLIHLKHLKNLESLDLTETYINDEGLEHLVGLSSLKRLELHFNKVTNAGVEKLKKSLPGLEITR
jgi:Leucine-rich repeat (LRR) protein